MFKWFWTIFSLGAPAVTVETLYLTICINVTIHFFSYRSFHSHLFCKSTVIIYQYAWWALSKTDLFFHWRNGLLTIIPENAWWSLKWNRKQKSYSNFWFKKWSWSWVVYEWSLMRHFLKQYLTEKRKGHNIFQVVAVAQGRWSLTRSGHYERRELTPRCL